MKVKGYATFDKLKTCIVGRTYSKEQFIEIKNQKVKGVSITHINLNDKTVEGIESTANKCFSVQHHPEASPGPHDSMKYFEKFVEMI